VPDGYESTVTVTLTFVPGGKGQPRVEGTIVNKSVGRSGARAKGCTDFTETEAVVGSPTGSVSTQAAPSGQFDATLSARSSTPKELAPTGTVWWLGTMNGAGSTPGLTGIARVAAPLAQDGAAWTGTAPKAPLDCRDAKGTVVAQGADAVESFTGLHPIVETKDGTMVFSGAWGLRSDPNAKGVKQHCGPTVWEGRILLVPHTAR
jgi:hypothetical protein